MHKRVAEMIMRYPIELKQLYGIFSQVHGEDGVMVGQGGTTDLFGDVVSARVMIYTDFPGAEARAEITREAAVAPTSDGGFPYTFFTLDRLDIIVDRDSYEGGLIAKRVEEEGLGEYIRQRD